MNVLRVLPIITVCVSVAPASFAQELKPEPIGHGVLDIRAAFPNFKQLPEVATALSVSTTDVPGHGLGLVFGAHWYPARIGVMTLGLGGEWLLSHGTDHFPPTQTGGPEGPAIKTTFSSISPQISFNFGKADGWSYISGGIGSARFQTEREDRPLTGSDQRVKALNYGGGARWFAKKHLALSLDVRFYAVSPQEATATRPAVPRASHFVLNAGIAVK